MPDLHRILDQFGIDPALYTASPYGSGLIHATFVLRMGDEPCYILQRVNHHVFRKPHDIAHNIRVIGHYLSHHQPEYLFVSPIPDRESNDYVTEAGEYYRLFAFVKGTHTVDTCTEPGQAWEAARQFGQFTAVLDGFRTDMLRYTIPGFHDLGLRYRQFEDALRQGDPSRIQDTEAVARRLADHAHIVRRYQECRRSPAFRLRVTHHDAKISNVLFDEREKGVCVIDLDTVMPGFFISDVGDMIRTYVSPVNEEEKDLDKVTVRKDFLDAILSGYRSEMHDRLSEEERGAFRFAGHFMVYMQALRFYTDHLNKDSYYGAGYEGQNLVRARNQLKLLEELSRC